MAWVVDFNRQWAGVAIRRGEHTYMVIGEWRCKRDALREPGRDAFNLLNPMTYEDAVRLNEMTQEWWPDIECNTCGVCQCHACRERRDRDAEMNALSQEVLKAAKVHVTDLIRQYFKKWRPK